MKKNRFKIFPFVAIIVMISFSCASFARSDRTIFLYGGDFNAKFIEYVAGLTDKENPKVCFVPTASADNSENIEYFKKICENLSVEPYVLKVWISSDNTPKDFREIIMDMDAIVVGGGNTLNMMAIWEAQGIDKALKDAYDKGIIMAGGSAGSICWFESGLSDSRPKELSIVGGMDILPYTHCPHYNNQKRKEIYHELILSGKIGPGYACDDLSGILFVDEKVKESVSFNELHNSYFVNKENGALLIRKLDSRLLVGKEAVGQQEIETTQVDKTVSEIKCAEDMSDPLGAFATIMNIIADGKMSVMAENSSVVIRDRLTGLQDTQPSPERKENLVFHRVFKLLTYRDKVAAVISHNGSYMSLWYLYNEDGKWLNAGEDPGGETVAETEIYFREKAPVLYSRAMGE